MTELYHRHVLTITGPVSELFASLSENIDGLSRRQARLAIMAGLVTVNGGVITEAKASLAEGQHALIADLSQGIPRHPAQANTPTEALEIIHEDEDLVIINKPSGLLSAPMSKEDTELNALELLRRQLKAHKRERFLGLVHRIDKETSGCFAIARTREAQVLLQQQFSSHAAERRYQAIVVGGPKNDSDTLTGKIGRGNDGRRWVVANNLPGKDAITHFEVSQRLKHGSLLRCRLETGRTHQIRVHLAAIGCPVMGDPVYGIKRHDERQQHLPRVPRLLLHADELALDHPRTGRRLEVGCALPDLFAATLKTLGA